MIHLSDCKSSVIIFSLLKPGRSLKNAASTFAIPQQCLSFRPCIVEPWHTGNSILGGLEESDYLLEELKGEPGWRMNRKPIESTLVACFMTLVIIVWSVAALIWPVPIIAGFLPNGMEQRRSTAAGTTAATAK
ncbi:hypothetical protein Q9233_013093 [Columba guinea]|nr:hypothetical protein Q9233_013093 [Columba guinea]